MVVGWGWFRLGVSQGARGFSGGLCLLLPHRFLPIGFGFFGGGEEEAVGHLVKGGVAWVFHPDNTTLVAMDTASGVHLHPPGVGDAGDSPDDWVLGTVAYLEGWGGGFGGGGGA